MIHTGVPACIGPLVLTAAVGYRHEMRSCVVLCRVSEEMLKTYLYPPGSDSLALMCGPPGMQDAAMVHLEKWGYTKDRIIIF